MINSEKIKQAVYELCVQANTILPQDVLSEISAAYEKETNNEAKNALGLILENAKMAQEKKMPLCQDTGQVLVFVKTKNTPQSLIQIINEAVAKAYRENFFRESVVKNAIFDRSNTNSNTPCVIYFEPSNNDDIEIEILIKGAGSENCSRIEMLSPTATEEEIISFAVDSIKKIGANACPPYFIGIGIGGTIEHAGLLSKKALLLEENKDDNHKQLAGKILDAINGLNIGPAGLGGNHTALDVKILTDSTHIACMPTAITVNCHSSRHAKCTIKSDGEIQIKNVTTSAQTETPQSSCFKSEFGFEKIDTSEIQKLKNLRKGQNILLSGEIYTARDAAHKRLTEMIKNGEQLPFDLKDKIIFYAGPCPACEDCVVGSIGPTTSARMDKYAPLLYEKGVLATIGKGERSQEVKDSIKQNEGLYFTAIGGIACLMADKFTKRELIAFEELGTEAVCRFEIEDLPVKVAFV